MKTRDKWNIVHLYRHYASLGLIPEVKCPECDDEVVPVIDTDGDPALQCFSCRCTIHLGTHVYDQMTKNIKEIEEEIAKQRTHQAGS